METCRFFHELRVRWGECDMQGIVFNPHYMMFCDVAFTEYMRAIGVDYPLDFTSKATDIFMVASNLVYRESARYDDTLRIGVRTSYLGTTSFRVEFYVSRTGSVLVRGKMAYVNAGQVERAARPLASAFIDRILAFEHTPPERKGPGAA